MIHVLKVAANNNAYQSIINPISSDLLISSLFSSISQEFNKRILVSTDLFGRGIDIERVNIVINYDFPDQVRGIR